MSALPPPARSLPRSNLSASRNHSIWSSTPRFAPAPSYRGHHPTATVQQASSRPLPSPPPVKQGNKPSPMATANRRPQCTHMTMNRLYGSYMCHMCNQIPEVGWVYVCAQDHLLRPSASMVRMDETVARVKDDASYFETQAQIAESIGMTESVISQMRAGEYSFDQIEALLKHRRHVIDIVSQSNGSSTPSQSSLATEASAGKGSPLQNIIAHAGTAVISDQVIGGARPLKRIASSESDPFLSASQPSSGLGGGSTLAREETCSFQACHRCRPFLSDRLYMSVENVLDDDMPKLTAEEATGFKVMNANIVRSWGLRQSLSASTDVDWDDVDDEDTAEFHTPRYNRSAAERSGTTTPIDSSLDHSDSSDGSDSNLYTSTSGHSPGSTTNDISALINEYSSSSSMHRQTAYGPGIVPDFADTKMQRIPTPARPGLQDRNASSTSTSSLSLSEETFGLLSSSAADFAKDLNTQLASTGVSISGKSDDGHENDLDDDEVSHAVKRASSPRLAKERLTSFPPEMDFNNPKHRTVPRLTAKRSNSSFGDEVEVEGGLALTEEAVETGIPDLVTGGARGHQGVGFGSGISNSSSGRLERT